MNGQVVNDPPAVGARINSHDLLARVSNSRFDRSRLTDFESQIVYLESEIANLRTEQNDLDALQADFAQRAAVYADWMLGDTKLKRKESSAQHDVAKARKRLEDEEVDRARQLYEKQLVSEVEMQIEKTQAEIAAAQVRLSGANLERQSLMLKSMASDGMFAESTFSEDGDASYWDKMRDSLRIRALDNRSSLVRLESQLLQAKTQAHAESTRIDSSFSEEHRAPFDGKVSARFVTQGTRVTAGSDLLQILNCTEPVAIVPIPDNRVSEFAVGMKVSIYPIDTEQELSGRIEYISSGPMLEGDTSIRIQQEFTMGGNRAIVSIDGDPQAGESLQSCETARVAVAVIHTNSLLASLAFWP
jgi:multidrug resistance efflux pump